MKKLLKISLVVVFVLVVIVLGIRTFLNEDDWICVDGEWVKHGNPSASKPTEFCGQKCNVDLDCRTPMEFLVQSNCPFSSTCLENECRVICPLFEESCVRDSDCDCSWRGNRTLDCLCLNEKCVSVEK